MILILKGIADFFENKSKENKSRRKGKVFPFLKEQKSLSCG